MKVTELVEHTFLSKPFGWSLQTKCEASPAPAPAAEPAIGFSTDTGFALWTSQTDGTVLP